MLNNGFSKYRWFFRFSYSECSKSIQSWRLIKTNLPNQRVKRKRIHLLSSFRWRLHSLKSWIHSSEWLSKGVSGSDPALPGEKYDYLLLAARPGIPLLPLPATGRAVLPGLRGPLRPVDFDILWPSGSSNKDPSLEAAGARKHVADLRPEESEPASDRVSPGHPPWQGASPARFRRDGRHDQDLEAKWAHAVQETSARPELARWADDDAYHQVPRRGREGWRR